MRKATTFIDGKCDDCQHELRVQVGKKTTVRSVRCPQCNVLWDYSAWVLRVVQLRGGGRATMHRIDFVKSVNVIQDIVVPKGGE